MNSLGFANRQMLAAPVLLLVLIARGVARGALSGKVALACIVHGVGAWRLGVGKRHNSAPRVKPRDTCATGDAKAPKEG